uniref:chitin synthase n=1 Tax=Phallusia mammillata TaxID=59560 RepID=A0A6F9DI42_9ASCI|nr:uncharacterized protein LOC101242576 [Phallusia mammillata]
MDFQMRPQRQSAASRIDYQDVVQLDSRLSTMNLKRNSVPADGNSFYYAVSDQLSLQGQSTSHVDVRMNSINLLRKTKTIGGITWVNAIQSGLGESQYLQKHSLDGEFNDPVMTQATASSTSYVINIVTKDKTIQIKPDGKKVKGELWLGQVNEESYVSLHKNRGKEVKNTDEVEVFNLADGIKQTAGILKQTTSPSTPPIAGFGRNIYEESMLRGPGMDPSNDDFPDFNDDNEPLIEDETPPYDVFYCEPPEDDSRTTSSVSKFFQKLFKLLSFVIFGGCVLAGGLINKACVLVLGNGAKVYEGTKDALDHDVIRVWSYIILLCMLLAPEVLTMGYSLYRLIMKKESPLDMKTFLWGGLWELLSAVGEGIIFIKVLPYLDATYACLAFPLISFTAIGVNIHAKWTSISHNNKRVTQPHIKYQRYRNLAFAIIALVLQLVGLVTCFAGFFTPDHTVIDSDGNNVTVTSPLKFLTLNYTYIWAFAGFILSSVRYWENFVTGDFNLPFGIKIKAQDLQQKLDHSRFRASFLFSLMKSLVLVGFTFLVFVVLERETYASDYINNGGNDGRDDRSSRILYLLDPSQYNFRNRPRILNTLFYVFATQACCALASFFFGRVACLTLIQREAYTFPTVLVTPIITACSAALAMFKWWYPNNGLLNFVGLAKQYQYLEDYVDWNIYIIPTTENDAIANGQMIGFVLVGLVLGWFATILITLFIWKPKQNRLERTEVLFVKAIYGGPAIDQALMLNRRQFETAYTKSKAKQDLEDEQRRSVSRSSASRTSRRPSRRLTMSKSHKFTPQLFLCATMWHETEQEMTQILTSLMRLDKDQGSRRSNATKDKDYYNFQVHVLFDDAMERTKDGDTKTNRFVHQLCELIPLAANKVELGKGYDLPPPVIYPTPYGGRLEFILPHGNLMVVHLKDKEKIRHRKRWSQCMYMYYILGYLQATKKAYKLEDVFLLALDGDVDFQPNAVLLLLDRMKRNPDVGAACGRIHPTGSGPVVWFQKFEYAVGHWLQKTAEHVLGCVLCSPGCFSMFRAAALVDVNVMNRYTTKATEALHYVQWDQGEDRWLCTLLLKQGWRIEYSAASDSFTFAPEEFKEFYNQRRRWGPSTMANIFDILMDAKLTVKNNIYISWGYISYQIGLMISSILGPATVIMIVQGAYQYVFSWSAALSLVVSLIPVIIFIILCYTTSADTQVAVAGILTILYALVMMAVIVGVIGAMVTTVILDPNSLFMIMLVGLYAFTGIVHPQEMMCLIHGVLYYLCVPSAFIFLMVYSLTNMNNVSWGTREVKKPAEINEDASAQNALEQVANKPGGKSMQIGPQGASIYDAPPSSDGYYSCGLGNLCQCALCITPKPVYIPVPTNEPKTNQPMARKPTMARRNTAHAKQSVYRKYSMAKQQQITGLDPEQIERRLSTRMSVHQLRKMSTKMGSGITTANLRKYSTQRRMSRRDTKTFPKPGNDQPSERAEQLARELESDMPHSSLHDVDLDFYDEEDEVDDERLMEEGDEMLYWVMDGPLEDGVIEYLDDDEREFWKYLIKKYLHPLDEDKAEKARIKGELKDLRNKMTGAYFLANALWLVLNFALQLTITDIAISFVIEGTVVTVNPISFAFLLFFLIILVIQFTCMLVHRWSTALHLLAVTTLKWNDARDGLTNTKQGDIDRENRKREKRKYMAKINGMVANDPEDPITQNGDAQTPAQNFSFRKGSGGFDGYDNETYDEVDIANSITSLDEDSDPYEVVPERPTLRSPVSTLNKQFAKNRPDLAPKPQKDHKMSTAINMGLFSDSKSKLVNNEPEFFNAAAADEIVERHLADDHKVRFVTTSHDSADEGNTQF